MGANVGGLKLWDVFGSAAPVTLTGTATETELMRIVIPGGVLGANGWVRLNYQLSYTANTNTKTIKIGLNGGTTITHTRTGASVAQDNIEATMRNRGAAGSQVWASAVSVLSSAAGVQPVSAVDTSQDFTLTIRGLLGVITDSITLESWSVEVFTS